MSSPWTSPVTPDKRALRRAVSADGRTDLMTIYHEMDDSPDAWHVGAVDEGGRVVAIGVAPVATASCPGV